MFVNPGVSETYNQSSADKNLFDTALNVSQRTASETQNMRVRPLYTAGPMSPNFDLTNPLNHSNFFDAISHNNVAIIDQFLHPENRFRRLQRLGRDAIYVATTQGNSYLVEQLLSRGVRVGIHGRSGRPPVNVQLAIEFARNRKSGDMEFTVIERLLLNAGRA